MSNGIYVATQGAVAQSIALDTTANNIANANTPGYHAERVTFQEALTRARSADIYSVGQYTSRIDGQEGALTRTDNPLDVALEGDGYFGVQTPNGPRYTRAGNFQLDSSGQIVTSQGYAVRGEGGAPIVVPPETKQIHIANDGTVSADTEEIGKLELARFAQNQLKREGETLYSAAGQPQAGDPPTVRAGTLEASNVNLVRGVVDLVKISRNYEALMRMIQNYHDIEGRAARDLGGPK